MWSVSDLSRFSRWEGYTGMIGLIWRLRGMQCRLGRLEMRRNFFLSRLEPRSLSRSALSLVINTHKTARFRESKECNLKLVRHESFFTFRYV
jgi:hypothetical protein